MRNINIKALLFFIQKFFCFLILFIGYYLYLIILIVSKKKIHNYFLEIFFNTLELKKGVFFFYFLGINFIIFLLYNRCFIERLPRNLNEFSLFLTIFAIFIICIQLLIIYKYTKALKNGDLLRIRNKRFKRWQRRFKIKYIHKEDLLAFRIFKENIFLPLKIQKAYNHLLHYFVMTPIYKNIYNILFLNIAVNKRHYSDLIYLIFFMLPKVVVISILLFEIIYCNNINYFYKFLWLYLLPLFFQILRYSGKVGALIGINDSLFYIRILKINVKMTDPNFQNLLDQQDKIRRYYYDESQEILYIYYWKHPNLLHYYELDDVNKFFVEFWVLEYYYAYWNYYYHLDNSLINKHKELLVAILTLICWLYILMKMYLAL